MVLRRFLGLRDDRSRDAGDPSSTSPSGRVPRPAAPADADTTTVRRIVSAMEALPEDQRRYVAAFAYILGRAAHADLRTTDEERALMERTVWELGGIPEAQAVLVVEIARSQNELYGGTEDYLVTRQFRESTSEDQRLALLRCCFAIGAAEGSISAEESAELNQIAKELDLGDEQLNAIRAEFTDRFEAVQRMRRLPGAASDG